MPEPVCLVMEIISTFLQCVMLSLMKIDACIMGAEGSLVYFFINSSLDCTDPTCRP